MGRDRRRRAPAAAPARAAQPAIPPATSFGEPSARRVAIVALVGYAGMAALLLVGGWSPDPRLWGVHALAFLPRVAWVVALVILGAALEPHIARRLAETLLRGGRAVTRSWTGALFPAVAAGGLFVALQLSFQFLGDGVVWLEKIEHRQAFHHFEPLATVVVSRIAHLSPHFARAAGWPSIAAGVAFIVVTASLCRILWSAPRARALGWMLLVVHPSLLLFFGYVESYPVLLVLEALFLRALVARSVGGFGLATGILALAIAWHLQAVAWLPALVLWPWAMAHTARGSTGVETRPTGFGALAAGLLAGALAVVFALVVVRLTGASLRHLITELGGESGFGGASAAALWGGAHVVDLANELALVLGRVVVLGLATGAAGRIVRVPLEGRWLLVAALLLGPALFMLVVVPRIGGARDWDLYLSLVLPVTLLAVEAWRRLDDASRTASSTFSRGLGSTVAGRSLVLAIVATSAYLAVQLDGDRAARRLETVQDPRGTFRNFARGYADETLGIYYRDHDIQAARDAYARAVDANPVNARYYNNLGNTELRLQHLEAARDAFRKAADLGMREWYVLHNLGVAELQLHEPGAAEPVFAEIAQRWPDRWLGHACLAQARLELGRPADALPEIERARQLAPGEPDVHYFLGWALRDLGRTDEARAAFEEALQLDPQHAASKRALDALAGN
jgi:Tetratricopeptide repeat